MIKRLAFAAAIAAMAATPAVAGNPTGVWLAGNGKSHVRISKCGAGLCGSIVKLMKPLDENGKPKLDKKNKNPALRKRRILGIRILMGMKPSGKKDQWKGRIYNAEDGKTYSAYMTLIGNRLKVEGCVAAIFCKKQIWPRVR